MTAVTAVTPSREALTYLPICAPCVRGEGSECHTPGCALFLRDVPTDGLIAEFALDLDTLADDEALVDDVASGCLEGLHLTEWGPRYAPKEGAHAALRALVAALSERGRPMSERPWPSRLDQLHGELLPIRADMARQIDWIDKVLAARTEAAR